MRNWRNLLFLLLGLCLLASPALAQDETAHTTVMVYMCGSNLESLNGSASEDIMEMLEAEYDKEQINVVLMAGGAESWNGVSMDASTTNIYEISSRNSLRRRWNDALLNMGESDTLSFFLQYAKDNYPAQRYALIVWDHGGGPLSGVCWDEIASDHLTMSELTRALDNSPFSAQPLEWIGFDACLMASVEVAWQLSPYARYMVASEETEPAHGWNYSFLNGLESDENGGASGSRIVSGYIAGAKENDRLTLSCIDLSQIEGLRSALSTYFDYLSGALNETTFSAHSNLRKASQDFGSSVVRAITDTVTGDYDLVDLGSLLTKNGDESWMQQEAMEALRRCIVASASTVEDNHGLSIYFPLYNKTNYVQKWRDEYNELNFSKGYTQYVNKFGEILTQGALADWTQLDMQMQPLGASDEDGVHLTLQLSPEQRENFASARLVALGLEEFNTFYRTFLSQEISISEDGLLEADYHWETLHVVSDDDGHAMTPSIDFYVTEEGDYAVTAVAQKDMAQESENALPLLMMYARGENDRLALKDVYVFDEMTQTYSNRLQFSMEEYPYLFFTRTYRMDTLPWDNGWQGFDNWPVSERIDQKYAVSTKNAFHLEFIPDKYDTPMVCFEITDTQNNVYMSSGWTRRSHEFGNDLLDGDTMEILVDAMMMDESGIYLSLRTTNRYSRIAEDETNKLYFFSPQINGMPCRFGDGSYTLWETEPESINVKVLHFKWPEGVSIENAESVRFRAMNANTDYLAEYEDEPPVRWAATEYGEFTWDRSLAKGQEAVSMNASYLNVEAWSGFIWIEYVPNYAAEAISPLLEREAYSLLTLSTPHDAHKPGTGYAVIAQPNASGTLVPLWVTAFDAQDAQIRVPAGTLTAQLSQGSTVLPAMCAGDGTQAILLSSFSFELGEGLGDILADNVTVNLAAGQVTDMDMTGTQQPLGMALGSQYPIGMTSALTVYTPQLLTPQGALTDEVLSVHEAMPRLPLQLTLEEGLSDSAVVLYTYDYADGSSSDYPAKPLSAVTLSSEPAALDSNVYVPSLYINQMGERQFKYGDFLADLSDGYARITGYVGTQEHVVYPESIMGFPVRLISYDYFLSETNENVRQVTLPTSLEVVNGGTEHFPNLFPRCGFESFPSLETIIVPECEQYSEVPLVNFILETMSVPYRYNTAHTVRRGDEEIHFADGFLYELNERGEATITDMVNYVKCAYLGEDEQRIPAQLHGHPVLHIADEALSYQHRLENVVIEEGIETIGAKAFRGSELRSLTLPASIREIGEDAFGSTPLQTVYVSAENRAYIREYLGGSGVKVVSEITDTEGLFAYEMNTNDEVIITGLAPDAVIGSDTLTIPARIAGYPVRRIADSAFKNAKGFTTLVIEEGITEIGMEAFYGIYGLKSVTLPDTLTSIESDTFFACRDLLEVRIPASVTTIANDAFYASGVTKLHFDGISDALQIPDFYDFYDQFEIIVCPEEAQSRIPELFPDSGIDRVVYAPGDERQGDGFTYVIAGGEATILSADPGVTQLTIPDTLDGCPVVRIASHAFAESALEQIALPSDLRAIGTRAFNCCAQLREIVLPDSVAYVGEEALSDCDSLTFARLSAGMSVIPEKMFDDCDGLTQVEIPSGPTSILYNAFSCCTALEQVVIPASVETIEGYAFSVCLKLHTVILSEEVKLIESSAFSHCDALKYVALPGEQTVAEDGAFPDGVRIFASLEELEATLIWEEEDLLRCGADIEWTLDADGTLRLSGTGALYDFHTTDRDFAPWHEMRGEIRSVVIGEGITSIGCFTFYDCAALETVSLPKSLTSIGYDSFRDCVSLREIVIPDSVTMIDEQAFMNCAALAHITLPKGLEAIWYATFDRCASLASIELPAGLKYIDVYAFSSCTGLTSIVIPDGTQYISDYAFIDCVNVTLADIPSSVEYIGMDIFADSRYIDAANVSFSSSPNYQYLKFIVDEGSHAQAYCELFDIKYDLR